ncbi:MAG: A1 family peptidase [Verrucomicrobia bacterium]|nr:A1 family peptidase [Verrucomicrobiota bacterium]MBI3866963.1 A1 family peptidase [Verrucomicrobiota bacterium]
MATIARIPITNIYAGGDYTGRVLIGPQKKPMNVLLDTGSSAFAIDGHKYHPQIPAGDKTTKLAQTQSYGDGSHWAGAVIETNVVVGDGASPVNASGVSVAVAYEASSDMFGLSDGILGLAYAALDDAFAMPDATWPKRYSSAQIESEGAGDQIVPYLTDIAKLGIVSDKIAFYTQRSFIHVGGGPNDPLNQGVMVLGGGEESADLYTGPFQTAKVLADRYYNTNLKAIRVGNATVHVPARGQMGMPSNSIVDSGTQTIDLGPRLIHAILSKFSASQRALLQPAIFNNQFVAASDLDLARWPDLEFILQGDSGDVSLRVSPRDYWQVNVQKAGAAVAAISVGSNGLAILGLPLMNGYFTIFDGEADNGRGVVKFATSKRP